MGIPSIFPNFGGMSEFFPSDYELKFEQYNYKDLLAKLNMINNTSLLSSISKNVKNFTDIKLSSSQMLMRFKGIVD